MHPESLPAWLSPEPAALNYLHHKIVHLDCLVTKQIGANAKNRSVHEVNGSLSV